MPTSLQIMSEPEDWLPNHLASLEQNTRQCAFDHFRRRPGASGSAAEDWKCARHETELCPLVSIEETGREVHIRAGVRQPESPLRIHVMSHFIVIESKYRNSILPLPAAIRQENVRAMLHDRELEIVAEMLVSKGA